MLCENSHMFSSCCSGRVVVCMPRVGLLLTLPLLVVPETAEMLAGVVREHGGAGVIQA